MQALEVEGITVAVRREGPCVGKHRDPPGMSDTVNATLLATASLEAIQAVVWTFEQRFARRAQSTIEGTEPLPPTGGRHRV